MKKLAIAIMVLVLCMSIVPTTCVKADELTDTVNEAVDTATEAVDAIEDVDTDIEVDDTDDATYDADGKVYTISPSSKPYNHKYCGSSHYNSKTKGYFVLMSYMERLEKLGGGTLVLKKGTYTISNAVKVPSNVTIIFQDGVTLKKQTKSSKGFKVACGMFQIVSPKVVDKNKKLSKYNGSHDVNFIGEGTVTVDMKGYKGGIAIVMGHAKNITIQNINFKHMSKTGHFIELNSSKNVKVTDCNFNAGTSGKSDIKECINIDSADAKTKGFNVKWSSHDKTCCDTVTISDCTFKNSRGGIGTHNYSVKGGKQQYHKNITVTDCSFYNCGTKTTKKLGMAIRMLNWKNANIHDNTFDTCKKYTVYGAGVVNPTIKNNTFKHASGTKAIYIAKYGTSKHYKKTYSKYSKSSIAGNTSPDYTKLVYLK